MTFPCRLLAWTIVLLAAAPVLAQPEKKAKFDGKAFLAKFAGTWTTTCELSKAEWTQEEMKLEGTATATKVLRGKGVHFTGDFLPGKKRFSLTLIYDEAANAFEAVYFDGGRPISFHGEWDAANKKMTLDTWDLPPTSLNQITLLFKDADTCQLGVVLQDRISRTYFDLDVKLTRQKP